ncbi:hypothetical protein BDU57DRAFT_592343 [Ampelomyces quisqualis]|uniref:Uncharacterized protein n=1 Tax=Ampelomyces quisqualis TaxID=50730 RepID=A0A6A5R471_AMPQU|nr:hypothetical protein BDU57DRAFT_592343 [Ampelomyces quisqualis]
MAEHGYRAMDIGRFMYTDKVRWLSTSRHDMDRMRSRVHDGNTVRQGICSAVPSAYTGPAGQGKSLEAEETMQKLNEAVQHADKPIEGASAANEEADGLLAATRPPQSSSMDAGGPARSECPMPYFSAHRNHLRADSHSDAGLRGGMGGQLEDEEYVYSYAPYRSWDESSAACSCADAECLGNQSGEKMAALKERIQALEEQIGEVEEAKNRGMEKARGRILGSSDDAEKKPERQSAGSVFVNVDGEIGGEALRQCECETGASETSKRRMGARQSPQIALDRQGKVRRASVRGGSGGAGAYALDTDDEYDRLIQDTVDACTPGSTPPCTEMLPTSRALQLRNKYLERQLEEASEMYDSAVQDLSWNMDMLRVVEEEVEELREEKDAALREVEGLKKILYREKERSEECQEAHVDQRPCDESSCHPCKPSVAAPSGVHPTSFNFYPSRSVIIVPGAPAQILQFPPATTLHDIKDSLDYASWSGADIDDCGLAIKNIMNARSKIGIELPYPLSDEVVVIGMPPRQLGEGGDKKKSLSRSAGEAHGVKEKGADKSVKIAAWETVDKDGYVEESSKGDECSGRAIPPELRDEQVDKSVKISAWETLDGDDYVEFIPRTKDVKKSTPRREDELKNTVHVQTDHLAGSMKMKPESSYIHEAHYTPMPRPRGYCCSHCQPTSASTVNAFPYISSVSVRGGGGDSDDEEEEDGDGKSDGGGDYFLLKPDDINDDVDHEDDPPTPETKYKNHLYEDSTADFEWEQGLSWYQFGDEEHGNVRLRGGGGDGVYEHKQPTYNQGRQTEWERHLSHHTAMAEDFDPLTAGPREPPPPRSPRLRTPNNVRREHAIRLENCKRAIDEPNVRRCYHDAYGRLVRRV